MMNYPPWATAKGAPKLPWMRYATGETDQMNPYRPSALGGVIPSVQRFGRLNPSEQTGYAAYVADNKYGLGLAPQDVFWLMNRLAPRGYTTGPRWAGR